MKKNIILLLKLSVAGTFLFTGCGGGGSDNNPPPADPTKAPVQGQDDYQDDDQVKNLGSASTISHKASLGNTATDLYLVLSNYAVTPAKATITHNAKTVKTGPQFKSISSARIMEKPLILRAPQYVRDFSSQIGALLSKASPDRPQAKLIALPERMEKKVGDTESFCVYVELDNGNCTESTAATLKKVIPNIGTAIKTKTLNIWVSDDSFFGPGCKKSKCVTQEMVNALADTFLKRGLDNDIYDWVTNIYGEEWGDDTNGYRDLISANDEITILLTDIPNDQAPIYDTPDGGIIGFFWSKDNFKNTFIKGSNERIMFYADAVMFANGGDTWSIDDFWPKEMVSTLAHEFQHMINFYQKRILLDTDTEPWINEMLSETTEDLIATKIKHIGPRGVEYTDGSGGPTGNEEGRYPLFNKNNTLSLTAWNDTLADYSKINAFGAYLIRNYGGAKLLHDVMHNTYTDKQAIVDAVNKAVGGSEKTFNHLLHEWGIAVLLSDIENPENLPTYNTGWFTESVYGKSVGETTYEMGSINFFNYYPLPAMQTTSGTVSAQGNYYYKIGENLTGDITIDLKLNGQTEATLIAK